MGATSIGSAHRTPPAIEVAQLSKTYPGGVEAVKGIEFQVAAGEVFGLLGPNGAGKSTTIGMLTTTVETTSGTARLVGFDVRSEPVAARRVSAVVFQEAVVDRALTGRRNLEIHARLWGVGPATTKDRIADVALVFGLADLIDRPVATYSGGERRRLEIARALLSRPEVLFLDEPTVGAFDETGGARNPASDISLDILIEDLAWWTTLLAGARTEQLPPGPFRKMAARVPQAAGKGTTT